MEHNTINKTMLTHQGSILWSIHNIKKPEEVSVNEANDEYLFVCTCGKDFLCKPMPITKGSSKSCPCCQPNELCNNEQCNICYEKTIATVLNLTITWSFKNDIKSWQVLKKSQIKRYFNCSICQHELFAKPCSINIKDNKMAGCTYCNHSGFCNDH